MKNSPAGAKPALQIFDNTAFSEPRVGTANYYWRKDGSKAAKKASKKAAKKAAKKASKKTAKKKPTSRGGGKSRKG